MYIYIHNTYIRSICSLKTKQSVVLVHTHHVAQHCWTASNAFAFSVQTFSSLQSHSVGREVFWEVVLWRLENPPVSAQEGMECRGV